MTKIFLGPIFIGFCMLLRSTDVFFRANLLVHFLPFFLITLEHMIGSCILLPKIGLFKKIKRIRTIDILPIIFIVCGSSVGGIYFFTKAFAYLNPAIVILLQKLQPLIATLLAIVLLKEKPARFFLPLSIIALLSSYILTFKLINPLIILNSIELEGSIYALLSVFFWGGGTVFGKKLLTRFSFFELTLFRYFGGFIFSLIIFGIFYNSYFSQIFQANTSDFLAIIYISLIPGLLALFLFYRGLEQTSAIHASFLELIFPVCSTFLAWKYLNRPLDSIQIISGVVLLASVTVLGVTKSRA